MDQSILIRTETRYVEKESNAEQDRFVFAYTILIENGSEQPVQLLSRHWQITDAHGEVQEVRGTGVVGQQPKLAPGEAFRYTSAAVLSTPVGSMHGHYNFVNDEGLEFPVPIPAFSLSLPNLVH